jgi:PAS domain S-box-containing protein
MANNGSTAPCILIVDDIPDTVQLLTDWLQSHDYRTIGVTSSARALEVAAEHVPDLILLDVMMPKMDGMETCRRLKANPKTAGIPVILVTAKNPSDARAEGMMAGAVDYITKPINLMDLVQRIENALAATSQAPVDVQRLLEEVAHSALMILPSDLVWLLALDNDDQVLRSEILTTSSGSLAENDFLKIASAGRPIPEYALTDLSNPLCATLITRKTSVNIPIAQLKGESSTQSLHRALEILRLNYLTIVPLIAAGKTSGVMVLGTMHLQDTESLRAQQILASLGSQAAIAMDYSRLIRDLSRREQEMQTEQTFRQMILDTMTDGLVVIDSKGQIKYVNRRLLRMTGYPTDYLEGRTIGELFHPEDRNEIMTGLLREGAATMKFDQRLLTKDGQIIHVLLSRSRSHTGETNDQVIVLGDMTDHKEREIALERQTSRLLALNRAAQVIAANLSLHDTLHNILYSALEVVEAQGAALFLVNKANANELIVLAAVGAGSDIMKGMRVPLGEGIAGWVAREAQSQLVSNIAEDPRFYRGVDEKTGMQTQSLIAVPLIAADEVIGVIEVVNKINGVFDQDDVRLLESMAGTAAVSIANARLFDESQRRVIELGTLLNASAAASSTLQFSNVLEHIARNLAEGLDVASCIIMTWNASKYRLESLAEVCDVFWPENSGPLRPLSREPLTRAALISGSPVVASLLHNGLAPSHRADLEASGMTSMLASPLWVQGSVAGVATLFSANERVSYTDHDIARVNDLILHWQEGLGSTLATANFQAVTELAQQLLQVHDTCWVRIQTWNAGEDFTRLVRELGFAEWTHHTRTTLLIEHYPTMRAVIERQQVRMATLDMLADNPVEYEWLVQKGGRSCLMVPLIEHGAVIGLVNLINRDERIFDDEEISLAQGIANVVSTAMENARLYYSLQSRAKALESAYAELQELDKAKDQFIQNVSHELRTPLIHVLGYAGLLAEGQLGLINDEQREALHIIVDKAQKLAKLVEDIVSMQALETPSFDRHPVDLTTIIREVIERNAARAEEANLKIVTRFPRELPPVMADSKSIGDAFEKLLDNALKFGAEGERVEVMLQDTDGPMVQVGIHDNGIGIDPSEHEKIFRRFYQVDGGAARRYAGTGLGLALTKAIIEGHGGKIWVKSKPNEGSTFFFTLPKYSTLIQE